MKIKYIMTSNKAEFLPSWLRFLVLCRADVGWPKLIRRFNVTTWSAATRASITKDGQPWALFIRLHKKASDVEGVGEINWINLSTNESKWNQNTRAGIAWNRRPKVNTNHNNSEALRLDRESVRNIKSANKLYERFSLRIIGARGL